MDEISLDASENINNAKILAICALGLGSIFCGLLPLMISQRNRMRFPLIISSLLCFGAGVLLATSIVHMLPEVKEMMPKYAEVVFCCGFFVIYIIDEIVHLVFGDAFHRQSTTGNRGSLHRQCSHSRQNYGADQETTSLLHNNGDAHNHSHENSRSEHANLSVLICDTSQTIPFTESLTGTFGLLCALSLHSFIEGLAIGIQDSSTKVMLLLGAVACHKYLMGFCLGLELCENATTITFRSHILAVAVFSLGSSAGIGAGMAIVDLPDALTKSALPILQGLAGGTLLYVTVSEVLPREKANRKQRYAGIVQFFAVGCGFAVMTIINFYLID